jgi:hypothetical protein
VSADNILDLVHASADAELRGDADAHQGRDTSAELRATLVAVRADDTAADNANDRWLLAGVHLSPIAGPL